ncbi:hypothetical protein TSOC_006345 [Tetrabaena socialis]|uniref:Uncharacterized protein n=1 Tax=Tetrabaena socialis TaxID=47790 RepID=A0A2J8A3Z5_9CHLO|nr:hypothetical protein TSOC_006345 [Tetrabaena socialis]|eukprot:PNH07241.1 hypothetical protein TSOC_006345 [Tetrabaena socialis]
MCCVIGVAGEDRCDAVKALCTWAGGGTARLILGASAPAAPSRPLRQPAPTKRNIQPTAATTSPDSAASAATGVAIRGQQLKEPSHNRPLLARPLLLPPAEVSLPCSAAPCGSRGAAAARCHRRAAGGWRDQNSLRASSKPQLSLAAQAAVPLAPVAAAAGGVTGGALHAAEPIALLPQGRLRVHGAERVVQHAALVTPAASAPYRVASPPGPGSVISTHSPPRHSASLTHSRGRARSATLLPCTPAALPRTSAASTSSASGTS